MLEIRDDIAFITFDQPQSRANVMSRELWSQFRSALDELASQSQLRGLILQSTKPGIFIAGADLKELGAATPETRDGVRSLLEQGVTSLAQLETMPFPTLAVIDGACLGGGLEIALACDLRLVGSNPKVQLGLPEVKLGLIPGWGGTQRLPRIIGISRAIEMLTTGTPINATTAIQRGLADAFIDTDDAIGRLRKYDISRRIEKRCEFSHIDPSWFEIPYRQLTSRPRPSQAALTALRVVEQGAHLPLHEAIAIETSAFLELAGGTESRNLIRVFFAEQRLQRDSGIDSEIAPRTIDRVEVVGAGLMGCGIAGAFLARGVPTAIRDELLTAQERAPERITKTLQVRKMSAIDIERTLQQLHLGASTSPPLIIEAIIENESAKIELFRRIEATAPKASILASNTSTISITRMANALQDPTRFAGLHFFNPVERMRLVEVIRGEQTSDEVVCTLVALVKKLGKVPIVVRDGPGFIVNRTLFPYLGEAMLLLEEGVSLTAIDEAALKFGMPMGPLHLCDVIGLDVTVHAMQVLVDAFPDRFTMSSTITQLIRDGHLGQKSGQGFYRYGGLKPEPMFDGKSVLPVDTIIDRLITPMSKEAQRILDEGIARSAEDIEMAMILGCGFPADRRLIKI